MIAIAPPSYRCAAVVLALSVATLTVREAQAKDAFVFIGATGGNALRPSGVWQGLFEAFAGGIFDKIGLGVFVAMNTPHTTDELHTKVLATLTPLYQGLKKDPSWKCRAAEADCSPERMLRDVKVNIWPGRDANAQAANMTAGLAGYDRVSFYMSVPTFVFGQWAKAAVDNWDGGAQHRVHVAVEKPFGTSLIDANRLHQQILDAGVVEANLHLVDHWLSFFMNKHLPFFMKLAQSRLGVKFDRSSIASVSVVEFETRGLEGRGEFFDGVGQVRDMVQSHLLQVLALALADPDSQSITQAKLAIFNETTVKQCHLQQYSGFLLEKHLEFHPAFADSTFCEVSLSLGTAAWEDVPLSILTGKDMGELAYTVNFRQKGGPGILTIEVGKEETGIGGIKVQNWPLKDASEFEVPAGGFDATKTFIVKPNVVNGTGYVLNYSDPNMYFPKPYAMMLTSLVTRDYGTAFVTYPECQRSWEIVTASSPAKCLDPPPQSVRVYKPPQACGNVPPQVCLQNQTVENLYNQTFKCTAEHDAMYKNVSLYKAKCHPYYDLASAVVDSHLLDFLFHI